MLLSTILYFFFQTMALLNGAVLCCCVLFSTINAQVLMPTRKSCLLTLFWGVGGGMGWWWGLPVSVHVINFVCILFFL